MVHFKLNPIVVVLFSSALNKRVDANANASARLVTTNLQLPSHLLVIQITA